MSRLAMVKFNKHPSKLLSALGILAVLLGLFLPASSLLSIITGLISPSTPIRPEWVAELASLKAVLIIIGAIALACAFVHFPMTKGGKVSYQQLPKKFRLAFFGLLLLSFGISVAWAMRPLESNIGSIYGDDFFYFLKGADNLVKHGYVTFDGTSPTNGFQPLWMAILAGLATFISSKLLLIKVATIMLAMAHTFTSYFLYRILLLYRHERSGMLLAIFWAFNPFAVWAALSGFETALYLLLLTVSIWYYLKHRNGPGLSWKKSLVLGALLGLTFLARLDAVFFCAGFAADYLFMRRKHFFRAFKELIPCGIILGIFALCWFGFSYATTQELFPISGAAKSFVGNTDYYSGFFDWMIKKAFTSLAIAAQMTWYVGFWHLKGLVYSAAVMLAWIAGAFFLVRMQKQKAELSSWLFLGAPSLLLFLYYILSGIAVRYVLSLILLGLLGTAFLIAGASKRFPKKQFSIAVAVLLLAVAANMAWSAVKIQETSQLDGEWNPLQDTMYHDGVAWIDSTPEGTIVGSFNAGILGYFSSRIVVNLDGVMNNNAYYAMRDYELYDYLRQQNISYVIDWDYVEDFYFKRFGGEGSFEENLELVKAVERQTEPHKGLRFAMYRVKPPPSTG